MLVVVLKPFEDVLGIKGERIGSRIMYLMRAWDREEHPKSLVLRIPPEDDVLVKLTTLVRGIALPREV